jgi:hypothetical protein
MASPSHSKAPEYLHSKNSHTLDSPLSALPEMLKLVAATSLLDVGCGTGTWLRAALENGIQDVWGVDGVHVPAAQLHVSPDLIRFADLTQPWVAHRRFDLVLCLEVAEHLEPAAAGTLIDTLVTHSDHIFFSGACPGQPGQHHVNCQWPDYWQRLFNERGFVCEDEIRWQIWEMASIETWYRQNLFLARRDSANAGKEPRIPAVVHPEMIPSLRAAHEFEGVAEAATAIEAGSMPVSWYLSTPLKALAAKAARRFT